VSALRCQVLRLAYCLGVRTRGIATFAAESSGEVSRYEK
jgi:hypothetical protein